MSHLKKIDHVSYACAAGTIEKWAWFHIEVEGGTLIKRIDDARPGDPDSSMKIWCIDYGDFGIALVEGIDRAEKSKVTNLLRNTAITLASTLRTTATTWINLLPT